MYVRLHKFSFHTKDAGVKKIQGLRSGDQGPGKVNEESSNVDGATGIWIFRNVIFVLFRKRVS